MVLNGARLCRACPEHGIDIREAGGYSMPRENLTV